MGEASIEQLDIEITSSAVDADKAIDKMIAKLGDLANAMKGIDADRFANIAQGMKNLSDAVQGFANVKAPDFNRIANGIEKIGSANIGNLKEVATAMAEMREPLENASNINIGQNIKTDGIEQVNTKIKDQTAQIEALMQKYQDVGTSKEFNGTFAELQSEISKTESKISRLNDSIAEYVAIGRNADSKTFEGMIYRLQSANSYLDSLKDKMADIDAKTQQSIQEAVARATAPEETADNASVEASEVENIESALNGVEQAAESVNAQFESMQYNTAEIERQIEAYAASMSGAAGGTSNLTGSFAPTELGEGEKYTEEYKELAKAIAQAEAQLIRYRDKEEKSVELGTNRGASWKSLQYDISLTEKKLNDYYAEMKGMQASGEDVVEPEAESRLQRFSNALSTAGAKIKGFGGKIAGMASKFGSFAQGVGKAVSAAKKFGKSVVGMLPSVGKATKSVGNFFKSFKSTLMRMAIRKMINLAKEGFENIARYSQNANATMSALSSDVMYLKNSFAAAFLPILQIVEPILTKITDLLVKATNAIGMFFASLRGATSFTKAVKTQENYAASLDKSSKAAKKLANATGGIDELNIISDNSDNGGGAGGTDPSKMFEDVEIPDNIKNLADKIKEILKTDDWSEIGRMLADKINEAMASIPWDKIQAEAERIAHGIGTFINGFVEELDWTLLGYTIGQGINTALIFAHTLLSTVNWQQIGEKLAEGANGIFNTVDWKLAGQTIADGFNVVIDTFYGFCKDFDWSNAGKKFGEGINSFADGIHWDKAAQGLSKGIAGILDFLTKTIEEIDWQKLADDLITFVSNIDWTDMANSLFEGIGAALGGIAAFLWELIKKGFEGIKDYFDGSIEEAGGNVAEGIFNGIIDAFKNIGKWIKENVFDPFIEGFKKAFGIHSPSTVMAEQGGYIVEGLLKGITDWFGKCKEKIKEWAGKVVDWFTGGDGNGNIVEKFKTTAGNIVGGFRDKIGNTYNTVKSNVSTWASKVKSWFTEDGGINKTKFGEFASNAITGFKDKVGNTYSTVKTNVSTWASKVKSWFTEDGGINNSKFQSFATNIVDGFKSKVGSYYTTVQSNVTTWANKVRNWYTNSSYGGVNSNTFTTYAQNVVDGFKTKIGSYYTTVQSNITTWAGKVKDWYTNSSYGGVNSNTFTTYAQNVVDGFKTKIGSYYSTVQTNISTWASKVKDWFSVSGGVNKNTFTTYAQNVVDGFKSKVGSYYTTAKTNMTTFATSVKSWFEKPNGERGGSLVTQFTNIGKNIIQGFIDGVSSLWNTAMEKIKDFGKSIISKGKEGTDEHSPSRAFKKIGAYVVEGFNIGVEENAKSTYSTLDKWTSGMKSMDFGLTANVGTNIDDTVSKLKGLKANMGTDFAVDTVIKQAVQSKNVTRSVTDTTFAKDGMKEAFKEALNSTIEPILQQTAEYARITSQKSFKADVRVGGKQIASAVEEQKQRDGFSFTPVTVS